MSLNFGWKAVANRRKTAMTQAFPGETHFCPQQKIVGAVVFGRSQNCRPTQQDHYIDFVVCEKALRLDE